MDLRICHLYPDLLNLYGDRGNLMALAHRAQWRGIDVHVEESRLGVSPAPGAHDLYFMGGGEDRQQVLAAADVRSPWLGGRTLVGFENHGGRTRLGPNARPLGTVVTGFGNNGEDRTEGAVSRNVYGTYLHGPLLPKNPALTDHLLTLALRSRHGPIALASLDDRLELAAHSAALVRATSRT